MADPYDFFGNLSRFMRQLQPQNMSTPAMGPQMSPMGGAPQPPQMSTPVTPMNPPAPPVSVMATPPASAGRAIMERSGDPRFDPLAAAVPAPQEPPAPPSFAPVVPPMPASQHVSGTPFMQTLMQQSDADQTYPSAAPVGDTDRGTWSPSPADSGPTAPSATSAGRSLLERIFGSDDPSTRDRFGLTQADRHTAGFNALGKLGFQIMAASMPQSPGQRAQTVAGMGNIGDDALAYRSAIQRQNNAVREGERQDLDLEGKRAARDVMNSPEFQEAYKNMPKSMQALARAAAATGDTRTILGMMIPRAVKGGYVDPATGNFIPTGDTTGAGGKVTEFQARNATFATVMRQANQVVDKYESEGTNLYGQLVDRAAPGVISNYLQSDKASSYFNAQKAWAENMLRLMTGAAAPEQEVERYRTLWFPQPGESTESIARKRQLRSDLGRQIEANAGHALLPPQSAAGAPAANPDARRAAIEAEARKRGLIK